MLKKKITTLINLIKGTEIEEIEVSSFWGAQKIKLTKNSGKYSQANIENKFDKEKQIEEEISVADSDIAEEQEISISELPEESNETKIEEPLSSDNLHEVKAPLVGTYYSSPKPTDPPFINIGDKVTKGQIICVIEAMKIFNEIESDVTGIIKDICIENGNPVEFDQLILKILPE